MEEGRSTYSAEACCHIESVGFRWPGFKALSVLDRLALAERLRGHH